ncbi:hypothetical protein WJX81_002349 [Elliptochloris bilobata]|uniref:Cytochrome P450 n=1 Tax=Elliptochloris bilobata TaxID=381761 RepID=A0AAW1RQP2_9CHLO
MLRGFPGPGTVSVVSGHVPLLNDPKRPPHVLVKALSEQYRGIFRLRLFWRQAIYITDPFLLQEVFAAERAGIIEKPVAQLMKVKGKTERNMFSERSGNYKWKLVRKAVAPAFSTANLKVFHHHITTVVDNLIACIKARGPSVPVDIANITQRESFDVIGRVGFDHDFGVSRRIDVSPAFGGEPDVFDVFKTMLGETGKRFNNPMRFLSRTGEASKGERASMRVLQMSRQLMEECRANKDLDERSIAAHLLQIVDPTNGKPLTLDRLEDEASVMFVAGSETTGYSIAWTLYLLAKHPEAMAKLEAELDEMGLLVTPARPRPRTFAFADISKLRYLDAILKESMRMRPVVTGGSLRVVARDLRLSNGLVLPRGITITGSNLSLLNNPTLWEHPERFMPERFEDPEVVYVERASPANGNAHVEAAHGGAYDGIADYRGSANKALRYTPFGNGMRNCVGQQLAKVNMPTALGMLVSNFKFELTPETAAMTMADLETVRGTLQFKDGLYMFCTPRDAPAAASSA